MNLLNNAEHHREAQPMQIPRSVSPEQRLMMLADAARRAQRHYSAVLIEAPIEDRPRELPDGRMSVTKEAWNAHADLRDAVGALIGLAIASDAEGREV